tara:strand:+ start:9855 stop:10553 length:699 start_codon:yes stop_codon:yes gene_type:complete
MRVLIIGGTSGYGLGVVEYLLDHVAGEVVAASRSSKSHTIDVRKPSSVRQFFMDQRTPFDVVVYSAGLAHGNDYLADKDLYLLKDVFDVNTIGLANVLKYAFMHLEQTKGHFIHIGSIAAYFTYAGAVDYCAAKAASNSIMKGIRYEWLGTGIRTTSIEIGLGYTNFQTNRYKGDQAKAAKHFEGVRQINPYHLGEVVKNIINLPAYLNMDEIILKPLDQVTHGVSTKNLKK